MKIDAYAFGKIVVDGEVHTQDLLLLPDGVEGNWWRKQGHALGWEDLAKVLEARPEVLVVGTGASGLMKVPPEVKTRLAQVGIELIVARSGEAWQRFNELSGARRTAGAFHLTC
ncbi:MAG: Mth938-like domain-containing protein [Planctomycetota bacterium]